ncbi:unnamed protein product, partial [Protopolystoma xenopodis]
EVSGPNELHGANVDNEDESGEDDGASGDSSTEAGKQRTRGKRRGRKVVGRISKQKMTEIQQMIDADRRRLEEVKDMAVEERNKVQVMHILYKLKHFNHFT